jgi:hypothetical protein
VDVENPGSGLEQALNVARIHQLMGIMGSQASHLENFTHLVLGVRRNLKVDGEALFLENTLALNKMVAEPIVVSLLS